MINKQKELEIKLDRILDLIIYISTSNDLEEIHKLSNDCYKVLIDKDDIRNRLSICEKKLDVCLKTLKEMTQNKDAWNKKEYQTVAKECLEAVNKIQD